MNKHPNFKATAALCGGLLLASLSIGCEEAKPTATAAPAGSGAPAAAKPAAPAAPAAAAKLVMEESKNEKMGYTIMLPKGATTTSADENGGMYMHDTMIIKVDPSGVAAASVDDVLRGVNTGDGAVEKKTVGDVFIAIVTKPSQPLNIYAGPKGAKVMSHCMAEPSMKDLAIEICSSLKSTK